MKTTNRGFAVFGSVSYQIYDRSGEGSIRIQESSGYYEEAKIWLFIDGEKCKDHLGEHMRPAPLLGKEEAKQLIVALQKFVDSVE